MGFDLNVKNDNAMYLFFQFFLVRKTLAMPQWDQKQAPYTSPIKCYDGKVVKSGENNVIGKQNY